MRELNECKAEVFRRSKNRIKERKKTRNRILTMCIPLCLIVTLFSVMILPTMIQKSKNENAVKKETVQEDSLSSLTPFVSLKIINTVEHSKDSQIITDSEKVATIHYAILDLFNKNSEDFDDEGVQDKTYNYQSESASHQEEFSICFTTDSGSDFEYSFVGNELYDVNNDLRIYLSIDQVSELKRTLGLSE